MSSPFKEPDDTLFLPTPFQCFGASLEGSSASCLPRYTFLFVCFLLCLPPSLSRFHSTYSRVQTSCWGSQSRWDTKARTELWGTWPETRPGF